MPDGSTSPPRLLEVVDDGAPAAARPEALRVGSLAAGVGIAAAAGALPFVDGSFDAVSLATTASRLAGRSGGWLAREVVRVVRPGGAIEITIEDGTDAAARRAAAAALRTAGIRGGWSRDSNSSRWRAAGARESGVSAETWATLAAGRGATAWNDSMFEFQRTPYDPKTIAGRIFLRRVRWVARRVRELGARSVLEVGCEAGGLLRHLDGAPRIVGLDLSLSALRTARAELGTRPIALVHADATRPLPFRDGEFDAVIASEVLEHCRSPRRIVGEIHRVLAPRGRAVFTIPNERRYLAWKEWLARFPLTRLALRGIEEGPAAWHVDHDFDRDKLLWLVDGFFEVERENSILGTTLAFVLEKITADRRRSP